MSLARHPGVRVLASETLYEGRILGLVRERVQLPSGLESELEIVVHGGAVAIAAQDAAGRLLLVRQYRHAAGAWMSEIPAGRLEPGEVPEAAARRELEEETGYRAAHWSALRTFLPAPGFCSERLHLFHASGLEPIVGGGKPADPDEELALEWWRPSEILTGDIDDAKTLIAAATLAPRS